jgi:hypothetical protein
MIRRMLIASVAVARIIKAAGVYADGPAGLK